MKIIIAGDGKVGLTLTQKLSAEGHDLTLIDSNQKVLDSSVERYDVMGVQGNCASMRVLESADVRKADLLIAATSADEINLLCCMTAHGLNPKIHTIARIRNPEYGKQIFTMRDVYSLSLMVNPEKQAAREIERLIKYPGFLQRDTFAKSRVEIVELRIDEGSKLCNVALNDLDSIIKCKVLVCAVSRKGVAQIPDGHFVLQEGDRVFVTAPSENLTILLKNLGVITHKAKRVIICGGGRIGYYLAERLARNGVTVQLIEQDEDRCVELSDKLPKEVCVIHGDASSQFLLESEGVSDCDALVSMTGIDEMNMIISLYAKNCGVPQVITKVGHMEIHNIHDTLGLGSVVCPKELCCNNIVRYVRAMQNTAGAALTLHNIAEGQAEALEFVVDEKTRYIGTPLREMKTKANVLIVCISHGSKTEIPSGDSMYQKGDSLIVVAKSGMSLFEAVCTAMGTAGTGGFGIKNDSIAGYSPYIQNVCTVFMLLFGVNFGCYYLLMIKHVKAVFEDEELRMYFAIVLGSIVLIVLNLRGYYDTIGETIRHAAFQVASIVTTTGFATTDFDLWPSFSKGILFALMIVGACAGSTGGGLKCGRVVLLLKNLRRNTRRVLNPHRVEVVRVNGRRISEDVLENTNTYLVAYVVITLVSVLFVSIDGLSLTTNLTAVVSCFNNIGPGLEMVGPTCNFGIFSWFSKLILIFDMLAGRLEIFPMLILVNRSTWRRR